jgi:hypothetical protein
MSSSCGQCLCYDVSEWPRQAARTDSQRTNRSGKSLANGSCRSSGHTTGRARTPLELLVCGGAPRRNRTGDPILTMAKGEFLPASSKSWIPRDRRKSAARRRDALDQRRGDPWRSFGKLPDPSGGLLLPGCCPTVNPWTFRLRGDRKSESPSRLVKGLYATKRGRRPRSLAFGESAM